MGTVLVDIGAGSTTIAIYDQGNLDSYDDFADWRRIHHERYFDRVAYADGHCGRS